jgi:alkylation response protein AidB-like acyl-CoA dehydrogenase
VDFTLGPSQQAVIETVVGVLGRYRGPGRDDRRPGMLPAGAAAVPPDGYDLKLWQELGRAGLLGLPVPAWLGGGGLGVLDTAVLLTELGRRPAAVPALATLAMGILPVTRWGDRDLQRTLLTGTAEGDVVLTAAVREPSEPMPPVPATVASLRDGSGTVSGVKVGVPYAAAARWILVPAALGSGAARPGATIGTGNAAGTGITAGANGAGGTAVVVIDPSAGGTRLTRTPSSAGGPEYTLRLDRAPIAAVLGGDDAVADLYQLVLAGACCLADGAVAAALGLTTEHVAARHQFGRPLATFQAVAQHIADTSIMSRTLHLATLSGCWRLDTGRPAGEDLDVAAYWLADQAPAALMACHHLHGGTGMDATYPLHRYSALIKDLVRLVGGADYRLGVLGAGVAGRARHAC